MSTFLRKIVKENGVIKDEAKLDAWFAKMKQSIPNGESVIDVTEYERTAAQNKYYWKCIVGTIANSVGYGDSVAVHNTLKSQFLPSEEYITMIVKRQTSSTTQLTRIDMSSYIERCIEFAASLGIIIPDAEEYKHLF